MFMLIYHHHVKRYERNMHAFKPPSLKGMQLFASTQVRSKPEFPSEPSCDSSSI